MDGLDWAFLLLVVAATLPLTTGEDSPQTGRGRVIEVEGGPRSVVWVVQLSDLHLSVHHPERAYDLQRYVGPALAMINPSLVLITGDLTDGKSKDLLTMKLDEVEWKEYQNAVDNIVQRSGLNKDIFYDLRGNHDCFGVPKAGGVYDYYHKCSINARTGRNGNVQSVTLQNGRWRHLFVGFDSTMETSLRGPTNVFGHPTDQLLAEIDFELSQWDDESSATKVSFGHFPLSFSALTDTGKSLKDVFLKHSLSVYLCGHLHTKFGKNLKRHHQLDHLVNYFQLNIHQGFPSNKDNQNCSSKSISPNEFWEWEMGDWRWSRTMRVLAIDYGHVSYVDIDFRLGSKDTIILPTFPLDSRFMQRISSIHDFKCQPERGSSYELVRTLVFSKQKIVLVSVKVYDTHYGTPNIVLDSSMERIEGNGTRGDLYVAPWNWKAFADPSPSRYWLQIEALDNFGKTSYSELRPFSINGLTAQVSWTWKEFFVMGIQWPLIYQPALWAVLSFMFLLVVVPQVLFLCCNKLFPYEYVRPTNATSIKEHLVDAGLLALMEFPRMTEVWLGLLLYLFYLLYFPWFFGHVFGELNTKASMSYQGWSIPNFDKNPNLHYVGIPDIMVVVLPHLCFVVLPTILVVGAMVVERTTYRKYFLSLSGKKDDDFSRDKNRQAKNVTSGYSHRIWHGRWPRKLLLLVTALILWKHLKNCRALVRAYDMNPFIDSPVYCFVIPLLLIYAVYKTSAV
ncbi:putative metallophosphoesterase At3g03305 isoform X1 [Zingiber officinale]|uniref:Calcineurin-like phosphoesterase domain-containing protein n=2 Tax=Zingiber officinale TaxID=94328 RepID=A0A8J5LP71_ZINOF|nr:putative metallophosphoesterase At3g03305 isoform X1 [Zingiber officinale]KAG6522628.1 hypothetical protein ZIOFF_019774 [Zingiber officinale]